MRIRVLILSLICIVLISVAKAQGGGKTIIHKNAMIEDLLVLHLKYNEAFPSIEGYRIQLLMKAGNTALDEIHKIKDEFEQKHPYINTYVTFREPYYRLRVGDFRTRLEAMEYLDRIKRNYPQAWVIKDKISFPELTKYKNTINYE
jgi:hypothetical protein